jgi:hypothetical protein
MVAAPVIINWLQIKSSKGLDTTTKKNELEFYL